MVSCLKKIINEMKLRLPAKSINESVCRAIISAFSAELNPTVEELGDLRCAVSEAVTNCIVHAYRYQSEGEGYIYISARLYDSREITVEISDNGCGIDKSRLENIFNGYYRKDGDTGDTKRRNAGIGLSVCATIIKAHGGSIYAENRESGGAEFTFELDVLDSNEIERYEESENE